MGFEKLKALLSYQRTFEVYLVVMVIISFSFSLPTLPLTSLYLFPSPLVFSTTLVASIYYGLTFRTIKKWKLLLFYSIIPPVLIIYLSLRWIKLQKSKGQPYELYAGVYILIFLISIFTLLVLLIVFLSLLIQPYDLVIYRLLYFATFSFFPMLSVVLSQKTQSSLKETLGNYQIDLSIVFFILSIVVIMVSSLFQLNPISIMSF